MKFSHASYTLHFFFICLTTIIKWTLTMAATSDRQIDQRLAIAAMQNTNIKEMLDEFTSNWSGSRERVVERQDEQLSRISGSKHYSLVTESSSFTLGMPERALRNAISLLLTSNLFKKLFNDKIDQKCKFYHNSEFTFKDDVLTYTKLTYMAYDPSNSDRFATALVQYGVKLYDIGGDMERFLACISNFSRSKKSCVLSERWTKETWSSFEDWIDEAAIHGVPTVYLSQPSMRLTSSNRKHITLLH